MDGAENIRFLAAELAQQTLGASVRMDWAFTPALGLQLYFQPFVSAGRYERFKVWTNPSAARYRDRFVSATTESLSRGDLHRRIDLNGDGAPDAEVRNPDFTIREFDLNAVARWEFRPGSTLFLAWSHDRRGREVDGGTLAPRDLSRLIDLPGRNVLLVKVSYWMNP